jgi:hypothetical protein
MVSLIFKIDDMKKNIIVILIFLTVISGCSELRKSPSDYFVFDDVQYVSEFPQSFTLDNPVEIDLESMDLLGLQGFRIIDSLLILSVSGPNGVWAFVSLPDLQLSGRFLSIGQGPNEFSWIPELTKASFVKEDGTRYVHIYDSPAGRLYKMNIDESIKDNKLSMLKTMDLSTSSIFNFCMIDTTAFFCKEIQSAETQQIRYILENGQKTIPAHFEKLNQAFVPKGEDFNMLSTITLYNSSRQMIVEAPVYLNYINMYSIDGSFCRTICLGSELNHIPTILRTNMWDRIYTFGGLRLFPQFWGVAYINENNKAFEIKRKTHSTILLFDWDGKPLAELKLNTFITSFDIDVLNGYLYTSNHQTDKFCRYDIRHFLRTLLR